MRRTGRKFRMGSLAFAAAALAFSARAQDAALPVLDRNPEWMSDETVYMIGIEALIVEVNEDKTRDLGLHYGVARTEVEKIIEGADVLLGRPLNPVSVPRFSANSLGQTNVGFLPRLPGLGLSLVGMDVGGHVVSARLRALLDQGQARIAARPIVLAMHDSEAKIEIVSEIPYQDIKDLGFPYGTVLDVKSEPVGIKMQVKPRILDLAEQTIELNITNIELSSLSNFISQQNVDRPVFNKADTRTKVTMKSGETYQLSGLKAQRKRIRREGVPILMNVPMMGHFFASREEKHDSIDIIFFVTPHLIPPGRNMLLPYDFQNGADLAAQGLAVNN